MEKSKKKLANTMLYYVIVLCIIAIIAVTLFTTASKKENGPVSEAESSGTQTDNTEKSSNATETRQQSNSVAVTDNSIISGSEKVSDTEKRESQKGDVTKSASVEEKLSYKSPINGYVSKEYRIDVPVYSVTMNDYRAHTGVDIVCEDGSAVSASAPGVIKNISNDPMMGTTIAIEHADGVCTYYMNMNETLPPDIEIGAEVIQGQLIGAVGSTALVEIAQEPHLHFEMTAGGAYVDPMSMLDMSSVTVMSDNVVE